MAYLHRLGRAFALAVLAFFASASWASFPATGGGVLEFRARPAAGVAESSWSWYALNSDACQASMAALKEAFESANPGRTYTIEYVSTDAMPSTNCRYRQHNDQWGGTWSSETYTMVTRTSPGTCPANSTLSGGNCTCTAPYTQTQAPNGGAYSCVGEDQAFCSLMSQQKMEVWISQVGRLTPGQDVCLAIECMGRIGNPVLYVTDKVTQVTSTEAPAAVQPLPCAYVASDTAAKNDTCPGGASGTVNGIVTCVPYDTSQNVIESVKAGTVTNSVTESTASGTTTSATTDKTSDSTTCSGATCTTSKTTTTTKPDGTTTTATVSKVQAAASFCMENASSPLCAKSGFSGSCVAGFVCNGDAAMCAVAKATNEQRCLLDKDSPEKLLYESTKAAGTATGLVTESLTLSSASFDQSNALNASASCIADLNVTVSGKAVTLPLSNLCQYLAQLGNLLVAVSFLLSIRIVGRG